MIFFSSFFDFYIGFRVFDLMLLIYVIMVAVIIRQRVRIKREFLIIIIFLIIISFTLSSLGSLDVVNILGLLNICITILSFIFIYSELHPSKNYRVRREIDFTIVFHLVFFYIQHVSYLISMSAVDYRNLLGLGESRLDVDYWRPVGLFAEPAHFCIVINLLLIYRLYDRQRVRMLDWVILISTYISGSTSGLLFCIFALATTLYGSVNKLKKLLYLSLFAVLFYTQLNLFSGKFGSESVSFVARFGTSKIDELINNLTVFGGDFSNDFFAGSGIFWIVAKYGILGGALVFAFIILRLSILMKLTAIYVILGTPIFSYVFLLVMVCIYLNIRKDDLHHRLIRSEL